MCEYSLTKINHFIRNCQTFFKKNVKVSLVGSKNGSFDFAEALVLCVGAKANVPLWVGNCLKKCAMGKKNKKHWVGLDIPEHTDPLKSGC